MLKLAMAELTVVGVIACLLLLLPLLVCYRMIGGRQNIGRYLEGYKDEWRNYFNFKGRIDRGQIWFSTSLNNIIVFGIAIITIPIDIFVKNPIVSIATTGLIYLFAIATIIPSLSLTIKRLHDLNKSGWWVLGYAVPFLNIPFK